MKPFMMLDSVPSTPCTDDSIVLRRIKPTSFSLGIFLLEIAYGRPWTSIPPVLAYDGMTETERLLENYTKAKKLCTGIETGTGQLGPLYAEAAWACINGDFGSGVRQKEFEDDDFLTAFYKEVICYLDCALESCEVDHEIGN